VGGEQLPGLRPPRGVVTAVGQAREPQELIDEPLSEARMELADDLGRAGVTGADRALKGLGAVLQLLEIGVAPEDRGVALWPPFTLARSPHSRAGKETGREREAGTCSGGLCPFRGPVATCSPLR